MISDQNGLLRVLIGNQSLVYEERGQAQLRGLWSVSSWARLSRLQVAQYGQVRSIVESALVDRSEDLFSHRLIDQGGASLLVQS